MTVVKSASPGIRDLPDSLTPRSMLRVEETSSNKRRMAPGGTVAPNAIQLSAMTRLFSSAVFREMAKKGRSALFTRLFPQTQIEKHCRPDATVGDAFDFGYLLS